MHINEDFAALKCLSVRDPIVPPGHVSARLNCHVFWRRELKEIGQLGRKHRFFRGRSEMLGFSAACLAESTLDDAA